MNDNIDEEIRSFIDHYLRVSDNLSTDISIAQQRESYEKICQHFCYPRPDGISSIDHQVPGRHGKINIRQYHNENCGDLDAQFIFIHGGGFILGSLDSHDDICAELGALSGLNAVSIDYRLAPEYHHPVHLDDVEDAYEDCRAKKPILVGISAGATLSAALCHRLRNTTHRPQGQVLIYPSLGGDQFDLESYKTNEKRI